jgi:hypothetical protein
MHSQICIHIHTYTCICIYVYMDTHGAHISGAHISGARISGARWPFHIVRTSNFSPVFEWKNIFIKLCQTIIFTIWNYCESFPSLMTYWQTRMDLSFSQRKSVKAFMNLCAISESFYFDFLSFLHIILCIHKNQFSFVKINLHFQRFLLFKFHWVQLIQGVCIWLYTWYLDNYNITVPKMKTITFTRSFSLFSLKVCHFIHFYGEGMFNWKKTWI